MASLIVRPEGCICIEFRDTGGFRIGDLACPVHGLGTPGPLDGPWETEPDSTAVLSKRQEGP